MADELIHAKLKLPWMSEKNYAYHPNKPVVPMFFGQTYYLDPRCFDPEIFEDVTPKVAPATPPTKKKGA